MGRINAYKYDIGNIINGLEILEKTKVRIKNKRDTNIGCSNKKAYRVRCVIDGYEYEASENSIDSLHGCPVCSGNIVVTGVNDVATTHHNLVQFFKNKEDAYTHSYGSCRMAFFICPNCGNERKIKINNFIKKPFWCNKCSDKLSFPNKFIYGLLSGLNVEFETEKSFSWLTGKRYDIYLPQYNLIIENHGSQHYEEKINAFGRGNNRTLSKEIENDKLKMNTALSNGISNYIVLDCRRSNPDLIRNSIMKSELPEILNFKECEVDWDKCLEFALSNVSKNACDLWNSGMKNVKEIMKELHVGAPYTISRYLKFWASLGMCDYDPRREKIKSDTQKEKAVYVYSQDGLFLKEYKSVAECSRRSIDDFNVEFDKKRISGVATGKEKNHNGYIFSYIKHELAMAS